MAACKNIALIGTSDFANNRASGAYYVDKTKFIRAIFEDNALDTLITRPRRFGKSLTMSTLQAFLEMDYGNPASTARQESLFSGLGIMEERDFCDANMGQWPVISLSLKDVGGTTFQRALNQLAVQISQAAVRVRFLRESEKLPAEIREQIGVLCSLSLPGARPSGDELIMAVCASIRNLEHALALHFGRPVVVLIDEYDVPLEKAREGGFYSDMLQVIRLMLGGALKDSGDLKKAVLTGCLRIARESVFTGLNNFVCHSVSDSRLGEAFGFTESETRKVLEDFGLSQYAEDVKAHYDGYRFGDAEIYSPWDVLNFCREASESKSASPSFPPYWVNTSSNSLVYDFVEQADESHFQALSSLLRGEAVPVKVDEAVSYAELDADRSAEMLVNVLYMTGYLTRAGTDSNGCALLKIPNKAVRACFEKCIDRHFSPQGKDFKASAEALAKALAAGDVKDVRKAISGVLSAYVSVRDSAAEGFYHGFMTGLLSSAVTAGSKGYFSNLSSNRESGNGYADLSFLCTARDVGVILEFKKAESSDREAMIGACETALAQIRQKDYCAALRFEGISTAMIYGMAFRGKQFAVLAEKIAL